MTAGFKQPPLPAVRWVANAGPVELVEPLTYTARSGRVFVVPAGFISDLESRPTWLPGIVNWTLGTALSTALAALLHDRLYAMGPSLVPPVDRAQADALYYEALRAEGHSRVSAGLAWIGLRIGGEPAWDDHRRYQ